MHMDPPPPLISILIPTKNERGNILPLAKRLVAALRDVPWELIFVDDSDDETPECIREAGDLLGLELHLIHRQPGQRTGGLGGAVLRGFAAARGDWICVMDADLQHPPKMIPRMLGRAQRKGLDLVAASRMGQEDGLVSLGIARSWISRVLAWLTRLAFPYRLKAVSDPLTGFFVIRRSALQPEVLSPDGFKILLEILVRTPNLQVGEVSFQIQPRWAEASKAGPGEMLRFMRLLVRLRLQASRKFLGFVAVGVSGLFVNSALLYALTDLWGIHYLLSALLAVQGSSAWNFLLTDRLVFGPHNNSRTQLSRLAGFFLLNNLFFLLRGPILTLLVAIFGIHYLLSNFISIGIATLIRYFISSRWIWSKGAPMSPRLSHVYDIHGILRIEAQVALPELEFFRSKTMDLPADIRIRTGTSREKAPRENEIAYSDMLLGLGFWVRIKRAEQTEVTVSPLIARSPHVLYTNVVEPLMRWMLVERGLALIHGACISYEGRAALITARTDTGKTTTILKTLSLYPFSFLSDDMTILSPDGYLYSFPKPLTISRHTLHAVDGARLTRKEKWALQFQSALHSRLGRKAGIFLAHLKLPAATLNAIVQMLVPPPKYHIPRLIPTVRTTRAAQLCRVIVIARGKKRKVHLWKRKAEQILEENGEDAYGFPPYPQMAAALQNLNGRDLRREEHAIISRALHRVPADLIFDPNYQWWRRIPGLMTYRNDLKTKRIGQVVLPFVQQRNTVEA
jgi:dolichol-phosphate mannosyltransferase